MLKWFESRLPNNVTSSSVKKCIERNSGSYGFGVVRPMFCCIRIRYQWTGFIYCFTPAAVVKIGGRALFVGIFVICFWICAIFCYWILSRCSFVHAGTLLAVAGSWETRMKGDPVAYYYKISRLHFHWVQVSIIVMFF